MCGSVYIRVTLRFVAGAAVVSVGGIVTLPPLLIVVVVGAAVVTGGIVGVGATGCK